MNEKNFRHIKGKFPEGVFADPRNPLISHNDQRELSCYVKDLPSKLVMVREFLEGDGTSFLTFVWQGKMSSDVFEITKEDCENILSSYPI